VTTRESVESNPLADPEREGMLAEYVALRGEILKRIELRHQYMKVSLAIAGAFLAAGVAVTKAPVALVFPLLAPFLAIGWAQNDLRVRDLAEYFREHQEQLVPGLGWETHMQGLRESRRRRPWRLVVMAHAGTLLFTQVLTIAVGCTSINANPSIGYALLALDVVAVAAVIAIFSRATR